MKFNDQELKLIADVATIEAIMSRKALEADRSGNERHRQWLHRMWIGCRNIAMKIDDHFNRRNWMATGYAMAGGAEWPRL